MLQVDHASKKAPKLSLNSKEFGMNLSQTVDTLLAVEVKRRYWEKWAEDNKKAMEAYKARIAREGLPLAKHRTFARSLSDGKKS